MTGHDVMAGYSVIALVTLAALIQYFLMGLNVGRARGRLNVPAPATQGHPEFERLYRVQLNTLEWLVIFIPVLWIAEAFNANWGPISTALTTVLGVLWLVGRYLYMRDYVKDPKSRGRGFAVQALATALLFLMGLVGVGVDLIFP